MQADIIMTNAKNYERLSRLQLASANRVAALTSRNGILSVQGIPNVKNR